MSRGSPTMAAIQPSGVVIVPESSLYFGLFREINASIPPASATSWRTSSSVKGSWMRSRSCLTG